MDTINYLKKANVDIAKELKNEKYDKVIECANVTQNEIIKRWQDNDKNNLEQFILVSRHALNYWFASIRENKLWVSLVRCGAWIGTLEVIQKLLYEETMDKWMQKRMAKEISSVKHLPEIIRLLEVKGVMTHSELVDELKLNYASTLSEIMKKIQMHELIDVRKSGKYSLYSLTDAGVRYGKMLRVKEDETELLKEIIVKYKLNIKKHELNAYLEKLRDNEFGVYVSLGETISVKFDNDSLKSGKVESVFTIEPDANHSVIAIKSKKKESIKYIKEA